MIRLMNFSDRDFAGFWIAFEKALYGLLLLGVIGFIAVQAPRWYAVLFPQISQVHLKGYFMHIDRFEMEKMIEAATEGDFFELDLVKLESDLENIGWVKNAWISHFTPHTLTIFIEEYQAEARWGNDFLLDTEGEIFQPEEFYPAQLPLLNGKYGREKALLEIYRSTQADLETIGLRLEELHEDHRRSLRLRLNNGLVLKLGTRNHQARFEQFMIAWTHAAEKLSDDVQCLDFRYQSGFAVGWRESEC